MIQEENKHLDFLTAHVPLLGRYIAPQYPFCFINDCLLKCLGYNDEEEFLLALKGDLLNLIHPDDRNALLSRLEEQLAQGDKFELTYRMSKADGTYIWLLEQGEKSRLENGQPVILSVCFDVSKEHELREKLNDQKRLYDIVLSKSNVNVWEYDLVKRCLYKRVRLVSRANLFVGKLYGMPEALLQQGYIHPDSIADYLAVNDKLFSGEKVVTAELKLLYKARNEWRWLRLTCMNNFDEAGKPVKAVITSEDITDQKLAEIEYQQEMQTSQSAQEEVLISYRVNLTQGRLEFLQGQDKDSLSSDMVYAHFLEAESERIVNADDKERYLKFFAYDNLQTLYSLGKKSFNLEYRRMIGQGKIIWVNAAVKFLKDALTGDLYLYCYVRSIDEQKNIELALKQRAEKDELTGTYNKETALIMMRDALNKALRLKNSFALLIFNIDNFRDLVSRRGYAAAQEVVENLSEQIKFNFGAQKITGKFYSDEFVLFLADNPKIELLEKSVEKIKQFIAMPYILNQVKENVSVSVGIALGGQKKVDLDCLYNRARVALGVAKAEGKNKCVVYSEEMSRADDRRLADFNTDYLFNDYDIKGIILRLAFSLVYCTDFTQALKAVLGDIAAFYGAGRAYIFGLATGSEVCVNRLEWQKLGITAAADAAAALTDFLAVYKERNSVEQLIVINDVAQLKPYCPDTYDYFVDKGIASFCLFPLKSRDGVIGYLAVDNLTCRQESLVLLDRLGYFIVNEIINRQIQVKHEYLSYHDDLTGLLNRNSYLQYLEEIAEETMISLGVVLADINGLKQINIQYGHEYGDRVIIDVAHAMQQEFKTELLYRFSSDEFLIICQNITKESFESQVKKLKARLEKMHPGWTALGYAWADSDILLDRLIIHADEKMMIAKNEYYNSNDNLIRYHDSAMLKKLLLYLEKNYFKLYLQPKAVIKVREVKGAEALVRMLHPKYGLVTPDKFIPQLEKNGLVSYIDFFIFEEVCKTLRKWIDQGVSPITISFNFSRSTILSDNLIYKMMQIYDKYQVPKELIEIEITESMGEVERETIAKIGFQIVEQGFRLSLDDFGAKYSNISVLSAMRLHVLKLDKSLVNDLFSNKNTRIIVKNFLLTCRELGIKSVAEGVETEEQLSVLNELDCDFAQGYYFNKPIPLADFEQKYLSKS
ncbi:MAG: EAL domain-containing protein [bacterium]